MTTYPLSDRPFNHPSQAEIEAGLKRAHELRAHAFHDVLSALAQGFTLRPFQRRALQPRHVAGCHAGC